MERIIIGLEIGISIILYILIAIHLKKYQERERVNESNIKK